MLPIHAAFMSHPSRPVQREKLCVKIQKLNLKNKLILKVSYQVKRQRKRFYSNL